jgi:hypothetical protein
MSKRIRVSKQGVEVQAAVFHDDVTKDAWLQLLKDQAPWGKPDRWIAASKDQDGVEYVPGEDISKALGSRGVTDPLSGDYTEYKFAAEYEVVEEDITQELADAKAKQEANAYLLATDWYVIRQMDTGVAMPDDVSVKRQQAREVL